MSLLARIGSNLSIRVRASALPYALAALVALGAAGCGGLQLGPAYPRDQVDQFHALARGIQADTSSVSGSLSDLRARLQGIAAGDPSTAVRQLALLTKEIKSVGQRLSGAVGKAAQLVSSGEKIIKTAPQKYGGPMVLHLPRKMELLTEAMGWLVELPGTGAGLVRQSVALTVCASDLLGGTSPPRCDGEDVADVAVQSPPPAQVVAVATDEDDGPGEIAVSYVTVPAGETVNFAGMVRDEYGNPVNLDLHWEVVAGGGIIDGEGQFTASIIAGSYARTVVATAAGIEAYYSIRVMPGPPVSVTHITPNETELKPGQRIRVSADVTDSHGNVTGAEVAWSVRGGAGTITPAKDKPNVAEFVAGKSPGSFSEAIQATHGESFSSANVSIIVGPVARIAVKPTKTKVPVHGARRFSAVPYDEDGNVVAAEVTWDVTASSRARISDRGMLMVGCEVSIGDYPGLVVAMAEGVVQPVDVQVMPGRAVSISLSETDLDLPTSGQLQLSATALDACGNAAATPVVWSLPMGGGTITQAGEFSAFNRTGTYTIVARSGRVAAQAQVKVKPGAAASIFIDTKDYLIDAPTDTEPTDGLAEPPTETEPADDTVSPEEGEGLPVPESRDAETPGEALTKAPPTKPMDGRILNFAEGVGQALRPTDDLYEPLPTGTAAEFLSRGYEIVHKDRVEFFVDREGEIYKDRIYTGVIPGRRLNASGNATLKARSTNTVTWVGFQPMAAMSRVFWQLTNAEPSFEVRRIDPKRIEVTLHDTVAANQNAIREMVMELFTGPVRSVRGFRTGTSLKYVIRLKNSAHYLYRYEAPYLYLDFEVDADY
jgi:hypothetical protein